MNTLADTLQALVKMKEDPDEVSRLQAKHPANKEQPRETIAVGNLGVIARAWSSH